MRADNKGRLQQLAAQVDWIDVCLEEPIGQGCQSLRQFRAVKRPVHALLVVSHVPDELMDDRICDECAATETNGSILSRKREHLLADVDIAAADRRLSEQTSGSLRSHAIVIVIGGQDSCVWRNGKTLLAGPLHLAESD